MFTLLIVCTANVCRSPLAASTLQQALAELPTGSAVSAIDVVSAGTKARAGQPICDRTALLLEGSDAGARFVEHHAARPLSDDLIADADLILVPDTENGTRIALAAPLARRRTFTLREADAILRSLEPGALPPLSGLVALMHAGRTAAHNAGPRRRFVLQRSQALGRDILDGHNLGARQHRRTLEEVRERSISIGGVLARSAALPAA